MNSQSAIPVDPITAGFLLDSLAAGHDVEKVVDTAKFFSSLRSNTDGPPSQEAIDYITPRIGKNCKMVGGGHVGVVHGVNEMTGMYSGQRYPLLVKITDSDMPTAIGCIFEYDLSQWEIEV